MGYRFRTAHANLVAFLTTPAAEPPRCERSRLCEFVGSLTDEPENSILISRDSSWIAHIRELAGSALQRILRDTSEAALVEPEQIEQLLRPLRSEFAGFQLYGLVIEPRNPYGGRNSGTNSSVVTRAAEYFANASGEAALMLFPMYDGRTLELTELDPLPAFATMVERQKDFPGVVLWTARGTAAFVPEHQIDAVVSKLLMALHEGHLSDVDHLLEDAGQDHQRRILQLSDLHFGGAPAARNLPLLEAELFDVVRAVDRVAITGDLFDNPEPQAASAFRAFRMGLSRISRADPLVIPGNHDQRILGNIGQTFEQISQIPWSPVSVDERLRTIFIALNSSIAGRFARGRVTTQQLAATGAEIQNAIAKNPRFRSYLRVVLVHHHPFQFDTPPTTFVQRLLSTVGFSDETFLLMEDADVFLDWCARWDVSMILHGHKHVARFTSRQITPDGDRTRLITAVGCGTSLGAEDLPLSYNIIHWDERRRQWMAKFFESRNGGPFQPKLITVMRQVEDVSWRDVRA